MNVEHPNISVFNNMGFIPVLGGGLSFFLGEIEKAEQAEK